MSTAGLRWTLPHCHAILRISVRPPPHQRSQNGQKLVSPSACRNAVSRCGNPHANLLRCPSLHAHAGRGDGPGSAGCTLLCCLCKSSTRHSTSCPTPMCLRHAADGTTQPFNGAQQDSLRHFKGVLFVVRWLQQIAFRGNVTRWPALQERCHEVVVLEHLVRPYPHQCRPS